MYNYIIIGNICSCFAMITEAASTTLKTAKKMLLVQGISQLMWFTSTIILKGYSGSVQNAVGILRNFVAVKGIENKAIEWTICALGVVLGVYFNNIGIMGYLPVIANLEYTIAVFRFKDNERALKKCFLVCAFMFAIFHLSIYNFVGFASNLAIFATTAIVLIKRNPDGD